MSKFEIDYTDLSNTIYKRAYKLSDVKDRLEVVAFDIVRFKDEDKAANLWQIQNSDDGDYIIALYNQDEEMSKQASKCEWSVNINRSVGGLDISYKGDPIVRVASDRLGVPANEIGLIAGYLPEKLASNKKLVKSLLSELAESAKKEVFNKYPELV